MNNESTESISENIWMGVLILLLSVALVGFVGLFQFKKWGRTITVVLTIISFLFIPFTGILVELPIATTINEVSGVLFGIVLCMAYLPPLENEFNET